MELKEGKYTIEKFMEENNLTRQSAINRLSQLKKQNYSSTSGGGRQKRIYTVYRLPKMPENGFYSIANKYSREKLVPKFEHYVHGNYTIEHAIIDGLRIGDARTKEATKYLFNHVTSWKRLFELAEKNGLKHEVFQLYGTARKSTKCKRIDRRFLK